MIVLIAALDPKNGIGINGTLPWHIKDDLKLFKERTLNHAIVMGRKTYESIGKPLPKRTNYVVSRNKSFKSIEGLKLIDNFNDFLIQNQFSDEIIYIIGGADIYKQALPFAQRLALSYVKQEYPCDTFFPEFDISLYQPIEKIEFDEFTFLLLEKK
jgi:dihydrofolate reductase